MAANKKLTPILAGRTVKSVERDEDGIRAIFTDGSTMKVKTSGPVTAESLINRTVQKVRQAGTKLSLDFKDGSSAEIPLAEATSSVMLRDKENKLEYAD